TPAARIASRAAWAPSIELVTSGSASQRCSIPVRATIHSWDVSTPLRARSRASSSLEPQRPGKALPTPTMRERQDAGAEAATLAGLLLLELLAIDCDLHMRSVWRWPGCLPW